MGIHYPLDAIVEDVPTHVEGIRHCISSPPATDGPYTINLTLCYWDGPTSLVRVLIPLDLNRVLNNGGTLAQWLTLLSKAQNASDTDDVAEETTLTEWGKKVLWAYWHGVKGAG
jgi:hypothetical protein